MIYKYLCQCSAKIEADQFMVAIIDQAKRLMISIVLPTL